MNFHFSKQPWWIRAVCLAFLGAALFAGSFWTGWWQPTVEELGRLCLEASRKQQWATLQEHAERWTDIEPQNGKAWMYVARALQQQREFDQAAICLAHVPDDSPESVDAGQKT